MPATATILGRIAEPVLRWTQGGHAVLELSIAATPRRKDRQTGEWADDGAPLWINATLWDAEAEAAAELLRKGDAVIATGTLALETYTTKNGQPGQKIVLRFPKVAKEPRPAPAHGAPANNHPPTHHDDKQNRNHRAQALARSHPQTRPRRRTDNLPHMWRHACMGHKPAARQPRTRPHHPVVARRHEHARQRAHDMQAMQPTTRKRAQQRAKAPPNRHHNNPGSLVT
jgi:single-strand DNA-binding protein